CWAIIQSTAAMNMKHTLKAAVAALILAIGFAGSVAAGTYEDGKTAAERGDYATALRLLRLLADQGNALAQFDLGAMYHNGHGVPQDDAAAASWYRKAANQSNARAQFILGVMYDYGNSVPQDYAAALSWYRKAAEQGNALAQFRLGFMY